MGRGRSSPPAEVSFKSCTIISSQGQPGGKKREKSRSEGEIEFLKKEAPTRWRPRSEGATRRTEKVVLPLAAFINLSALRPGVMAAAAAASAQLHNERAEWACLPSAIFWPYLCSFLTARPTLVISQAWQLKGLFFFLVFLSSSSSLEAPALRGNRSF